ncbi:NADH-quinone oxidoreductase subunit J [Deinococcus irradiatisoli]|uniref:NADH-quinone oxidoreductase subunit J n=1 Tax=Deinococcus irradiatisoli TaxID=2202254 RepID=A0A2Z3JD52_9DEIO|nr:NADH-quinone oxidoreductase subunit J [Deinococcus irradiatisoli]AWN23097.1 NADH-quinone oxidoreductase subunit J [Deinococcus irradiatisoli]
MITFLVLSVLVIAGGILTIAARNAVHASLGLVGTLLSVAGIYATLSASFLAATQVIVYAGAVMVLFLFVIMLLDANRPVEGHNPLPFIAPLAGIGGALLAGAFAVLAFTYKAPLPLAESTLALKNGAPGPVGETLLTKFLLPFEAVSILLLVAVVGSVALVQRPAAQREPVRESVPAPLEGEVA